jgi:hypothetical protein
VTDERKMGNITEKGTPALTLTEFERQCADLDAKDWNPRQIAAVLEKGEGAVLQALKSARLKMEAGRCEEAEERREQVWSRREAEAVALNYRTEVTDLVELAEGDEGEPEAVKVGERLRWMPWPFRDHAAQAG